MQSEHNEITTSQAAPRCPTCDSDLSMPGIDLGSAQSSPWTGRVIWEVWYIGAEHDCAFCRTIVAVIEHAQKTFGCDFSWMTMQIEAIAGSQYLLYVRGVNMPSPPQSLDKCGRNLGDIVIYLQSQSNCLLNDASNSIYRTYMTCSSKDLRAHRPICC
jgi:hypothetical protein